MKILTIDGLRSYFEQQGKSISFSAKDTGSEICLVSKGCFEIVEDKHSEGLLYCDVRAFHDLTNKNHSHIKTDVLKENIASMKDRPIMADIIEVEKDGKMVKDFAGHTMEFNEETGKIVYIEKPVGHFVNPENFKVEYDEEYDRSFAIAECVVYEEYTDACDILRRRKQVDCSVELCIREFTYDAKTKDLYLDDFYVQGCTLLGEHVAPGMEGSRVVPFESQDKDVVAMLEELNAKVEKIADFTINNQIKKGGSLVTKFEELLEQFGVTAEDVTFEYEGLTDEELEAKFAEVFGEDGTEEEGADPEPSDDEGEEAVVVEETEEVVEETVVTEEETTEEDPVDETIVVEEITTPTKYSITMSDGLVKEFELSLNEISNALHTLVNNTWGETDNTWYSVDVFEKHVVMVDWWANKAYKQSYTREGDEFSLTGDRIEVFANWLTRDEEAAIEEMRSNFSSIKEQLEKYQSAESKAQKEEILGKEAYAKYLETDEFKSLSEKMDEYSVDDFSVQADLAFAKCVQKLGFSLEEKPATKVKGMSLLNRDKDRKKNSRYGNLKLD